MNIGQRILWCNSCHLNISMLGQLNDCIGGLSHLGPNVITLMALLRFRTKCYYIWDFITFRTVITFRTSTDPSPPSWVVLSTIWNFLSEKQKLKIDCNFQFSNFRLPPKTEKLSHTTDCNIVGEAKICVMFKYSTKRRKSQIVSIWHCIFSDDKF